MYRASLNFVIYSFELNSKKPLEPHYFHFRETEQKISQTKTGASLHLKKWGEKLKAIS